MRDHRDFHQIVVTVNFCKSLIIYDVDATLSLLNKKKKKDVLIYLSISNVKICENIIS